MIKTTSWLSFALLSLSLGLAACGDDDSGAKTGDLGGTGKTRVENYLQGDEFTRLVLEVDSVDGFGPIAAAEQGVIDKISPLVDKPDGVDAMHDETIVSRGEDHAWSVAELDQLADETNTLSVGDNTIKMHVLFVDGHYEEDSDEGKVLGIAWGNQNIAIFKKTIQDNCRGLLTGDQLCKFAEQAIWTHEVGHVLGLVNNGVPVQSNHQDQEHGHHCNDDECVMYWAYEGTQVIDVLAERLGGGGEGMDFGAACKEDLAKVRGE